MVERARRSIRRSANTQPTQPNDATARTFFFASGSALNSALSIFVCAELLASSSLAQNRVACDTSIGCIIKRKRSFCISATLSRKSRCAARRVATQCSVVGSSSSWTDSGCGTRKSNVINSGSGSGSPSSEGAPPSRRPTTLIASSIRPSCASYSTSSITQSDARRSTPLITTPPALLEKTRKLCFVQKKCWRQVPSLLCFSNEPEMSWCAASTLASASHSALLIATLNAVVSPLSSTCGWECGGGEGFGSTVRKREHTYRERRRARPRPGGRDSATQRRALAGEQLRYSHRATG